jgi:hypothetical protein
MNRAVATSRPALDREFKVQDIKRQSGWKSNYLIAGVAVGVIALVFILGGPKEMVHWFVLPAMACGILMGSDVVRWLQGLMDPFDPKGLIGIVIFYGFFIAPMLHVYWNIYGSELIFTGDPRHWLAVVGCANFLGLILYKLAQRWSFKRTAPVTTVWQLIPVRILPILAIATVIAFCAQFYFYFVVLRRGGASADLQIATGYGWLIMLSDPLPILFLTAFIAWTSTPRGNRNWLLIAITLAIGAMAQFIWVGLRGSRSATVYGVFWAVGLVHYYWRRLRPVHLLLGLAILVPFLYVYGFYKSGGWRAVKALEVGESLERVERRTGRTIYGVLLGDLARADVQARIANEIAERHNGYQLRYGLTYLAALSKLIPRTAWELLVGNLSFKDDWGKAKAFSDLNNGKGVYHPKYWRPSQVYGLSGEAMLNFGFAGVPWAWFIFGLVVGWARRKRETLAPGDTRWVLMLFLSLLLTIATISDLDNIVFVAFQIGFIVYICIYLWSRKADRVESNLT